LDSAQCSLGARYEKSDARIEPVIAANTAAIAIAFMTTSALGVTALKIEVVRLNSARPTDERMQRVAPA
jgi:hypothetical protein